MPANTFTLNRDASTSRIIVTSPACDVSSDTVTGELYGSLSCTDTLQQKFD